MQPFIQNNSFIQTTPRSRLNYTGQIRAKQKQQNYLKQVVQRAIYNTYSDSTQSKIEFYRTNYNTYEAQHFSEQTSYDYKHTLHNKVAI